MTSNAEAARLFLESVRAVAPELLFRPRPHVIPELDGPSFTYLPPADGAPGVHCCNDCGGFSLTTREAISHHASCQPGSASMWERYYADNPDEEPYDD